MANGYTRVMGLIDYREVDWDHLETTHEQGDVAKTEAAGLVILAIILIGLSFFFEPVRNMFLSDAQLLEKYARRYPWLNRCDLNCEQLVDVTIIDLQYQCQTLTRWYYEEGGRDIYSWQLAIDDRATYLGCPGFPKEIQQIKQDVVVREEKEQARQEEVQAERAAEQRALEVKQQERFAENLRSANLSRFVVSLNHPEGSSTIEITMNANWNQLSSDVRRKYGQSMWQQWVAVYAPSDPRRARIRILNAFGVPIGGSPEGDAAPIWVAE